MIRKDDYPERAVALPDRADIIVIGGRVRGVRLADGRHIAVGTAISACDPRTLFVDWLDGVPAAAKLRATWMSKPQGSGYESKLDAIVGSLPVLRPQHRHRRPSPPDARISGGQGARFR